MTALKASSTWAHSQLSWLLQHLSTLSYTAAVAPNSSARPTKRHNSCIGVHQLFQNLNLNHLSLCLTLWKSTLAQGCNF